MMLYIVAIVIAFQAHASHELLLLSAQLEQFHSTAEQQIEAEAIIAKFNAWKVSFPKWGQVAGLLDKDNKEILKPETLKDMEDRIYRDISWKGLAQSIGITSPPASETDVKKAVLKRLQNSGSQVDHFNIPSEERINGYIADKIKWLIRSTPDILLTPKLLKEKASQATPEESLEIILNFLDQTFDICFQYTQIYREKLLFLKKRNLLDQWGDIVQKTWCSLMDTSLISPYNEVIKDLDLVQLKKINPDIVTFMKHQLDSLLKWAHNNTGQTMGYGDIACGFDKIDLREVPANMFY